MTPVHLTSLTAAVASAAIAAGGAAQVVAPPSLGGASAAGARAKLTELGTVGYQPRVLTS
jgi:hypothetical protein